MKRLFVFLLSGVLILTGCKKDEPSNNEPAPIPVKTAPVVKKSISIPIHTSGILTASENIKLSFKIGGLIDGIEADEGQSVRRGQIIASLDLTEINAQVEQAREGLNKAERDLKRVERLYKEGAATREQFQNATTAVSVAASTLRIAEFNLAHAVIRAPADGKILKRLAEQMEMIAPGYPVFVFAPENKSWIVRCGVADKQIIRLSIGDSAIVTFSAWPDKVFPATVREVAENIDPATGTFEVELSLARTQEKLISGFVARVEIIPSARDSAIVVPIEALVEAEGDRGFVFVPEDGKAKKLAVETGAITGRGVVIKSGLTDSGDVITSGTAYLRDGAEITISGAEK